MSVEARYGTPDKNGETRRERNQRFGAESPEPEWPTEGRYLWQWYQGATATRRYDQGNPQLLTPVEWRGWADLMGIEIRTEEYAVLMEMDRAFVNALRKELSEQMAREADRGGK